MASKELVNRRKFILGMAGIPLFLATPGLSFSSDKPVMPSGFQFKSVIDTLTIDDHKFDTRTLLESGFSSLVVDILFKVRDYPSAVNALKLWNKTFKEDPLRGKILKYSDFEKSRKEGKLGVIIASQYASILGPPSFSKNNDNLERLEELHRDGLRLLNLTHNDRTLLGEGYWEDTDTGLSRLGVEVVKRMNELGMIVDISHCSDKTTNQTIEVSEKPCIISHSACRSLRNFERNKTDDQIRALTKKGGLFCIYNISHWLTDKNPAKIEHLIDHIDHVIKLSGEDHVGFGSDGRAVEEPNKPKKLRWFKNIVIERRFPNHDSTPKHFRIEELDSPLRMQRLAEALQKRGYKARVIDKILGRNFETLFKEVIG